MSRILLFGGRGYLGHHFHQVYPHAVVADADIADAEAISTLLDRVDSDIVINCAGRTGRPNVDWCESHRAETFRSNVQGPLVLLDECLRRDRYLVHLSSGCIYEGDNDCSGYSEEDPPNFTGSFYSRSKTLSDQLLGDFPVLTLRLRMPFDGTTSERNLLMKLRQYSRVLDVPNSLTALPDFLFAASRLIDRRATGIWNIVNEGAISPFEIMCRYRDLVDPAHRFERLALEDLAEVTRAGRSNCVLSTAKLRAAGIVMPPIHEAIDKALAELAWRFRSEIARAA
jgi:dTDP-4-dehydrorhamnose reductase